MAPLRAARLCAWLAVAAVVVAAAEPSIRTAPRQRVGILELVVDRSGSTRAGDLAPTRLDAIRQATLALLDRVPERVRVGLVAFSDAPVTLARPTTDRDAVRAGLASLSAYGGTAVGDALRRALDDIQAASGAGSRSASPAAPAAVLLLSDGANASGSDPAEVARLAAARRVPVFAVAVGTPGGVLTQPTFGGVLRQAVPPDPALLRGIAGLTGGRAVEARSAAVLHAALQDLGGAAGVASESQEVTLLFAAAALLLLAAGSALSPRRRAAAAARRLAPVALLLAAGGAAVAWAQLPPPGPSPPGAALAATAPPTPPPPRPPFVTVAYDSGRDGATIRRAVALLRRHREAADQRQAEVERRRLKRIVGLRVSACDACTAGPLASNDATVWISGIGGPVCDVRLSMPVIRRQARSWRVPVAELVAMAALHEQELCLHGHGSTSATVDAEQRFARKLRNGRLFDRFYVQIDAHRRDRATVERAVAIVRGHGELAAQRRDGLRRRELNLVDPLRVELCRGCLPDRQGEAGTTTEAAGTVGCDIRVDLAVVERAARGWGLPVVQVVAVLLVHEQEHCIRDPDDRETPAIDAERRLARKLGNARLLEYVTASYRDLDASGHWKS